MAMNRAKFRKELQEGLNTVFGMEYKRYPEEWRAIFDIESSRKAYEEDVLLVGLGGAQVKDEGASVGYDEGAEAWVARYMHETIALAFAITEESQEDNLYGSLGAKYSKALARSMQYTKEVKGADVLNNAFAATALGGDGKALLATDHPLWGGGTFSNTLATAADLSETALEALNIQISQFVDDRGIPIMTRSQKLIVHTSEEYNATRILKSALSTTIGGSVATDLPAFAKNDINAMKEMGTIPGGCSVNHYLTDPDAWFLKTDCPDGVKMMSRLTIRRGMEGDFNSGNMRYKARERYSFGWTDPRGMAGSEGAA